MLRVSLLNDYVESYKGLSYYAWKGIGLCFIESTFAAIYYFLSLYFVEVLHMKISTAGIIISFYGLGTILGGWIGGRLSDKFHPVLVSALSLLGQGIFILILSLTKSPLFLSMILFIYGVFTYGFITSNYVDVLNTCQDSVSKLKAINILSIASNLGIGLAALLVGEIRIADFPLMIKLSSLVFILMSLSLGNHYFKIRKNNKIIKNNNPHPITKAKEITNAGHQQAQKNIILVLICLFFTGMIVSQSSTTYSIFVKDRFPELGIKAFSILFLLNTCLIILFQNYLVNQFEKFNKLLMVGVGSFLIGIGMFLIDVSYIFPMAILSCIIYSCGEMIFFSMTQLFCYQKSNENNKGRSLGSYRMVYASSRFLGPGAGSIIYSHFSGSVVWYLCGVIGVMFLVICHYFKRFID